MTYPNSTIPITPEPERTDFQQIQDEITRAGWQGRGCDYSFPSTHSTANDPKGNGNG